MTKTANKQVKEQVKVNTKKVTNKQDNKVVETKPSNRVDKEQVLKMFKKGMTPYQIAKELGKYYSQIAPIIERAGLTWEKRSNEPTDKKSRTIYCNDEQLAFIKKYLKENK